METNGGSFTNPSMGGMINFSTNDLMEDYKFSLGFRLPVNFSGLSYFVEFENARRRFDWNVLFLRNEQSNLFTVNFVDSSGAPIAQSSQLGKTTLSLLQWSGSYPLDRIRSFRMALSIRQDRLSFKAQDIFGLSIPVSKSHTAMSRVEYVFDNSISPMLNIRQGYRYKFFGEYFIGLDKKAGGFYNLGLDFRYYTPVYRHITFAARLAGAHSGGSSKILYFLGGVDNPLNARYGNLPTKGDQEYSFMGMATSLRGYDQNARNGNTYAVGNFEMRVPILSTFFSRPPQGSLLKNLQLTAFVDAGSAWSGLLPDAEAYSKNIVITQPPNPVIVQLDLPGNSGLALGYGLGLRTTLFGYFFRTDVAWNIFDHKTKPMLHFGLGTDF